MSRVKRGTTKNKSRKNVLAQVKGYRFGRSTKKKQAKEAIMHAGAHAFAHRRSKKRTFRQLWNIRINAAIRPLGMTYSRFIDALTKKNVSINRKMLSELAQDHPETFEKVANEVKS
ncbi:MAG: 50S ribosomal protein L20 [Candidatus Nomurabacteria bacterium]|nr:50S ribosomal protein L20 [Candidatus Nomurabacteria bacterium]